MSMWDFLNWLTLQDLKDEVSRIKYNVSANDNLESNLEKIFLQLYRNDNDISSIDLNLIPKMKDRIFWIFNTESKYKSFNNYSIGDMIIFIISTFIFFIVLINLLVLHKIRLTFFIFIILLISFIFSLKSFLSIWKTFKSRKDRYESLKKDRNIALKLKEMYPNLTPYGLYLKYFIDSNLRNVIELLEKNPQKGDPYKTLEVLYNLFDLKSSTELLDKNYEYFFKFFDYEKFRMLNDQNYSFPKKFFNLERLFIILLVFIPIGMSLFIFRQQLTDFFQKYLLKQELNALKSHNIKDFIFNAKIACFLGSKESCEGVGVYYKDKGNLVKSLEYFKKACDLGSIGSCVHVGYVYCDKLNQYNGIYFYEKSCNAGNALGCYNLGIEYLKGQCNVKQDWNISKKYFKKSCKLGNKEACKLYHHINSLQPSL